MADVFVSYASDDRAIAHQIARGLEGAGFSVWWDRHIHGGVDFATEIQRQLDAARIVVVLWSSSSLDSKWVLDEAQQAREENKLMPVRLDGVQPPLGFRQAQTLDFSGWNGDPQAETFANLVASVRHFVGPPPQGVPRTGLPTAAPRRGGWRGKTMLAAGAVLSFALAYFVGDNYWRSQHVAIEQPVAEVVPTIAPAAVAISDKSIAVLPFTDMSEKKDQEYLADGMAEEILNLLAQVPDLLVPARTSSFYFKGKQTKIPDIARELGVAHVLEGSIRRSGDHLRVTAQLVRADNGYHLWSETYDRELSDVFKVQDDIANAVVQALQIKLAGGELSRRKGGTQNLEAYQLYLRAVSANYQNTRSSLDAASEYLNQAVQVDPAYGMAWSLFAAVVIAKTDNAFIPDSRIGYEQARQLAQHALQLSPDLADAHGYLQYVHRTLDWDWAAAEAEGREALAIDPTNPDALQIAGMLSITLGRWEQAEQQFRAALARDPLNTYVIWGLGTAYYGEGRFAEAEGVFADLLKLAPEFLWTRVSLGKTLLAEGKPDDALAMLQQQKDEDSRLLLLPIFLQATGQHAEADEALQAQIAQWADAGAYYVAMTYAYRGDRDSALQWLERAYQQKDHDLAGIAGEPLFKNLADDPRYKAFLRKMNLPE